MFSCGRRFWANSIPHFDECGIEAERAGARSGSLGVWESGGSKRRERHRVGVDGR
jgi:hypothetical protein